MRRLLLIVFATCCIGVAVCNAQDREIRGITDNLSESLSQSGKKTVAVVDFTDLQGNVTELGRYLAEELSASLTESAKGIQVVDRTNLKVIIQENKLAATGIIDPATARKLGQIAGVDALITGTLTPFGDSVHLSIKILDTATARIVGAARGDIPKTKAIEELLGQGVAAAGNGGNAQQPRVVAPSPKTAQPAIEVRGIRVVVDACKADGETLDCALILTSELQDRLFIVQAGGVGENFIVAWDDDGVGHRSDTVSFGGTTSGPERYIQQLLVSDVPTRLAVKFNRFGASSTKVTLLKVAATVAGNYNCVFDLRNIAILR